MSRKTTINPSAAVLWASAFIIGALVITQAGRIVSVVDWGDMCTGDPATDLASLWILFDPSDHQQFWDAYGAIPEDLCRRSRAWAVVFGLMLHDSHFEADPKFAEAGLTAIRRVLLGT